MSATFRLKSCMGCGLHPSASRPEDEWRLVRVNVLTPTPGEPERCAFRGARWFCGACLVIYDIPVDAQAPPT